MTTRTVQLLHNASIPNACWCKPVGWEPANVVEGSDFVDGSWWDDNEETAGLVWFGDLSTYSEGEIVEANTSDLRVASCGDCRVIGPLQ